MSDRPHLTPDEDGRVHVYLDERGAHPGFTCDATRVEVVFHAHPDAPLSVMLPAGGERVVEVRSDREWLP